MHVVTNVYFDDEDTLTTLLASQQVTGQAICEEFTSRLKNGEGIVVMVHGESPRAMILRSAIEPQLKGTPQGDELICCPFG